MKFGINKCKVLTMQRGRIKHSDGLKLPDGELMKEIDIAGYRYLGMPQDDQITHWKMKKKLEEEYLRRVKKLVKSKLQKKNMIDRINVWAVGVIQYSAGITDQTIQDIKQMDIRTRKIMTMNGALYPRLNVGRLYLKGMKVEEDCSL